MATAQFYEKSKVDTLVGAKQDKVYTLAPTLLPTQVTLTSAGGTSITCDIECSDLSLSDGDWNCTATLSCDDPPVSEDVTFATSDGGHTEADTTVNFGSQSISIVYDSVTYTGSATVTASRTPSYCGAQADKTPTQDSNKLVTSGGVYDAVDGKQDALTEGTGISISASNEISTDAVRSFATVGTQTPTVTNGVADLSTLFTTDNTSLQQQIDNATGTGSGTSIQLETRKTKTLDWSTQTTASTACNISFAAGSGLRYCELLLTGVTAANIDIVIDTTTYTLKSADSTALTPETGDNLLIFAEYATNCFIVSRQLLSTVS